MAQAIGLIVKLCLPFGIRLAFLTERVEGIMEGERRDIKGRAAIVQRVIEGVVQNPSVTLTVNSILRLRLSVHGVVQVSPVDSTTWAPAGSDSTVHASVVPRVIVAHADDIATSATSKVQRNIGNPPVSMIRPAGRSGGFAGRGMLPAPQRGRSEICGDSRSARITRPT
jgi:hypothetical protein